MLPRTPRVTLAKLMVIVAVIALIMGVAANSRRKRLIESLNAPVAVSGWTGTALCLADGRLVPLPGMIALPTSSPALAEATKRGVELGADGRVYGLVRVHHWCGNDPIGEHIARIDLARFLEFIGEGRPVAPPSRVPLCTRPGGNFSAYGWEIVEYYEFRDWYEWVKEKRGASPKSTPHAARTRLTWPSA